MGQLGGMEPKEPQMPDQNKQKNRPIDTQRDFLTVEDVAAYLTIGVSTIWRQVKHGRFPKPVRFGGATRWRKVDIEALIASMAA